MRRLFATLFVLALSAIFLGTLASSTACTGCVGTKCACTGGVKTETDGCTEGDTCEKACGRRGQRVATDASVAADASVFSGADADDEDAFVSGNDASDGAFDDAPSDALDDASDAAGD